MAKIVNTEYTFLDFKSMGLNEATKNPNVITIYPIHHFNSNPFVSPHFKAAASGLLTSRGHRPR